MTVTEWFKANKRIVPLEMHLLKTQTIEMARSSSYLLVYQFASGTYIFAFSVSCTFSVLFSPQPRP